MGQRRRVRADDGGQPGVGYFEGCRYKALGVFKPVSNPPCLMNVLGHPFCPVCEEAVSLALWSHAHTVDSATPPTIASVQTTGCALQSFARRTTPPTSGGYDG